MRVASSTTAGANAVQRIIAGADLSPWLTPAGGILIVKSLHDPLPRTLRESRFSFRPAPEWKNALEDSLAAVLRHAARPAAGPCAGNAPAVFFTSEAELLATLALAALRGRVFTDWWWQTLLGTRASRSWIHFWSEQPHLVPSAIDLLERAGQLRPVMHAISVNEAQSLATAMAVVFGLRSVAAREVPWISPLPSSARLPRAEASRPMDRSSHPRTKSPAPLVVRSEPIPSTPAPVPPAAGDAPPALGPILFCAREAASDPQKVRFLAIALTLSRAPTLARASEFGEWIESPTPVGPAQTPPIASISSHVYQSSARLEKAGPQGSHQDPGEPASPHVRVLPEEISLRPTAVNIPLTLEATPDASPRSDNAAETAFREPIVQPWRPEDRIDELDSGSNLVCETEFGGIFYLANVAISLGLYGDFTQPLHPGIDISPWDLFFLVGSRASDEFVVDPVTQLLAQLAGRAADESMPRHEIPRHWLHPEEFVRLEMERRSIAATLPAEATFECWVEWIYEIISLRVDCSLAGQGNAGLGALVRERARLEASSTRLHVFYSLAEHPIAIRLAGLDRDPGWLPAARRTISFHYQ